MIKENYKNTGAKAQRLTDMKNSGINVPDFVCVNSVSELKALNLDKNGIYSVRSSASCEDGENHSFAGQFDTYLYVSGGELENYVEKCLSSAGSSDDYMESMGKNKGNIRITAIVQTMIDADISGVIFTANPQGILNETVIAVGKGAGCAVADDRTEVTHYYYNLSDDIYCFEQQGDSPIIPEILLKELIGISKKICSIFGKYQDIEFAVKDGIIWILQSRPITSLNVKKPVILDSSNISESYPNISLPLTVSFVKEVYYQVFRSCVRRETRNDGTAERMDESLRLMVDSMNGRVYYRISNWYDVIMLLPFSKKIIPVWQEMLGVGDKAVSHGDKPKFGTKLRVALSFVEYLFTNRRKMKWLGGYFSEVYKECSAAINSTSDPKQLVAVYHQLCDALAAEWDLTLINDMYTFIFTGLLKKSLTVRYGADEGKRLTNICVSRNSGIESMKPVEMLRDIRRCFAENGALDRLENISTDEEFQRLLDEFPDCGEKVNEYISLYGDRCPEELKLETLTYRLAPHLLCGNILSAVEKSAENEDIPHIGLVSRFFAKRAADGIKLRESSRLSRGRIFALVREIALKIADELCRQGRLTERRDVFWLTLEEMLGCAENADDMRETVELRKEQWQDYGRLPLYSRLVFAEKPLDKRLGRVDMRTMQTGRQFCGIPCSDGIAEGEIIKIDRLTDGIDTEGKIIMARMTDPGWVFHITRAKGIVSERGSLLSHTAIISRELGKPAVVGVRGLFDRLKDGDRVRINGATGEIILK